MIDTTKLKLFNQNTDGFKTSWDYNILTTSVIAFFRRF